MACRKLNFLNEGAVANELGIGKYPTIASFHFNAQFDQQNIVISFYLIVESRSELELEIVTLANATIVFSFLEDDQLSPVLPSLLQLSWRLQLIEPELD